MNPLLQKTEQDALAKANPKLVPAIQHVVAAGKQMLFGTARDKFFAVLRQNDPEKIGQSFAGIGVILFSQSGKKLPMEVLVPATTILLCEGLQFFEDSGKATIDANFLASATKAMGEMLLRLFKATPDKIQKVAMLAKRAGTAPQAAQPAAPAAPVGIVAGAQQGGA